MTGMTRYATMSDAAVHPVLVWDDAGGAHRVVERHDSLDDIAAEVADGLEVHRFTVPLTTDLRSPANAAGYPLLDGNGSPLWVGARIEIAMARGGMVTLRDEAVVRQADEHGGLYILCDKPHPVRDRNGTQVAMRREHYLALNGYRSDGPLKGHVVLGTEIGDPHETGTARAHVTLAESPLRVCEPVTVPSPSPPNGR